MATLPRIGLFFYSCLLWSPLFIIDSLTLVEFHLNIITCVLYCAKSIPDTKWTLLIAYSASIFPLTFLIEHNQDFIHMISYIHLDPFILYVLKEADFTSISKDCLNLNSKSHSPSQSPSLNSG